MATTSPEARVLPARVRKGDLQIEQDVRNALRYAAEAAHLDEMRIRVENGVVYLQGTVQSFDDIARVDEIVRALRNVDQVYNELEVQ
jgi:osmotically-inducible protein OsmY